MKTDALVTQLAAMFPQAFSEASLVSWTRVYREALERYEGAALRAAFDEVLSDWKYPSAPKPADFAAAADRWKAAQQGPARVRVLQVDSGIAGARARQIRAETRRLIDGWLRDNLRESLTRVSRNRSPAARLHSR
jgi:hypothetical protein